MPTLTVTKQYADNTILTEAQLDAMKNSLETFFNTTKIDDDNIQAGGISLSKLSTEVQRALNPTGVIQQWTGTVAPAGWLLCDGSAVSRTTYADLFTIVSESFGQGDNSTTFNLPDCRGTYLRGVTASSAACSGVESNDTVTATAHGFNRSGRYVRVTGTPVTGLSTGTTYYLIYVDDNTVAFATTLANAVAGTKIALGDGESAASMTIVDWQNPDNASGAESVPGSNSGNNVGALFGPATKLPNSAFTTGAESDTHTHTFTVSNDQYATDSHTHSAGTLYALIYLDASDTYLYLQEKTVSAWTATANSSAVGNTDQSTGSLTQGIDVAGTTGNPSGVSYPSGTTDVDTGSHAHNLGGGSGSGGDHETRPLSLCVNYIIKT